MINIDVRGLDVVQRAMRTAADQVPYALAKALTDTAWKVRAAEQSEIGRVFDRPTPWIQRQVFVERATKQTLTAIVGPDAGPRGAGKDAKRAAGIFATQAYGTGQRRNRGIEKKMIGLGWLPAGWVIVPARATPVDQYGNIRAAVWKTILNEARPGAGGNHFVVKPGASRTKHLDPGVWRRKGRKIEPVIFFEPRARYRPILPWHEVAQRTVAEEFPPAFASAFANALRTARR